MHLSLGVWVILFFSDRVIRIVKTPTDFSLEKILSQFRVLDNSSSSSDVPGIPKFTEKEQTTQNFNSNLYIISAAICIEFQ